MVAPWLFLAEAITEQTKREYRTKLFWSAMAIAGVLLLMALVVAWVKQWQKRRHSKSLASSDQLAHFRELYEQGDLSAEEFAQVRALLAQRLKGEIDTMAAPRPETQVPPPSTGSRQSDQLPSGNGSKDAPPPESPPPEIPGR